ncbi:MAG: hypothetical protein ABIN25_04465 [Ginsengibacter sp.]
MKMKILHLSLPVFLFLFILISPAEAQYFYKDIWNNQQLSKEFSILKNENLKTIKIHSYEDDGEPSEGFVCEKKINKSYSQSEMISKSYITGQSLLVSDYNGDGRIIKTVDETPTTSSVTNNEYDSKGNVALVRILTAGDGLNDSITETHEYSYDANGHPLKMERKKNNFLVSTINFVTDEKGRVIEENVEKTSTTDKKYFYYYNDKNQLTDVVHFNERAGRLLPDYMYEYNSAGLPSQMISTAVGGDNYFIWRYTYNDKKLRETEKCYSKEKRMLGKIEYEYK